MSATIDFSLDQGGGPIILDAVVFSDPSATYGIRDRVGLGIVEAANVVVPHLGGGLYQFILTTTPLIEYEYYIKYTLLGVNFFVYGRVDAEIPEVITGRYTDYACIRERFGATNVLTWASINGSDATAITALITNAIADAEDFIDDTIRSGMYEIPFTGTIPPAIKLIACLMAGVHIYEAKGVIDWDVETGRPQHRLHYQKHTATNMLDSVRRGKMQIDVVKDVVNYPESGEL